MSELPRADSVFMGDAAHVDLPAPAGALRSRRLLRFAPDDRLALQIRRGSEAAFEVTFERYAPAILAFCRHMLGSPEEAEDAVQSTFAAAYRDLQRGGEREIALKPWLFTIARNRCLSVLRAHRDLPLEEPEVATAGLAEQVEQRAELRQLVADVRDLPDEQRAALLLAEVGGLAQRDIASVLGCEVARVKALVYRARSALVARREARELPCEEIREQLANLRGGSLRRSELRLHLRECPGCRDFREQVRRQRQMLSLALPVAPTLGLKTSVLAAVGIGGGAAGGGAAAAGGAAAGGGAAAIAKVAAVAAIAVGGVAGGAAVVEHERHAPPSPGAKSSGEGVGGADAAADSPPASGGPSAPVRGATDGEPRQVRSGRPNERSGRPHERSGRHHGHSGHGVGRPMPSKERTHRPTPAGEAPPGQLKREGGRGQGNQSELEADHGNGRGNGRGRGGGPADSPPVRRGPPEAKVKPQKTKGEPKGSSGLGQASEPQNSQGGDSEAED